VLQKTDGVAVGGQPDKNDWIIDANAQPQVYDAVVAINAILQQLAP
jgi:hypothetical protein